MRIHILSDLHLEFGPFDLPAVQADVTVLAGDTDTGFRGIEWILRTIPDHPVIYILGNHEYYRQTVPKFIDKFHARVEGTHIHLLEQGKATVDDTVFLGCTLWSDMHLYDDPAIAEISARERMNDYQLIRKEPKYKKLTPPDTILWHRRNIKWMKKELGEFEKIYEGGGGAA
ncbi:MAG: metallophosphoesterase, partial [Candidatus Eisenbacteria bacterium]|nr:metallophosphoesterase [Candidatus Eisenbacteria bacterium]